MVLYFEYIWLDENSEIRSKTRILRFEEMENKSVSLKTIPKWSYNSSEIESSENVLYNEIELRPVALFKNPFSNNLQHIMSFLVLCETWYKTNKPFRGNDRTYAERAFKHNLLSRPSFGFEQEFYITKAFPLSQGIVLNVPIAFSLDDDVSIIKQDDYYCGNGGDRIYGREFVNEVFELSIRAGIFVRDFNPSIGPAQWKIHIKDEGLSACDQLIILRYILLRTSEKYGYTISFHPALMRKNETIARTFIKMLSNHPTHSENISSIPKARNYLKKTIGIWNGSGCCINFSE